MKILLTAVNAKYIHSNPAIYSLRAYADSQLQPAIEIAEYTINNRMEDILAGIYRHKPDVIAISCYIWNWKMIEELLPEIGKVLPGVSIWLGGPEVSYNAEEVLHKHKAVTGIMVGEGEETFRQLARFYCDTTQQTMLNEIAGIVYREKDVILRTEPRELTDLSSLPFLYYNMEPFENRIIYYESSRGCPYRCSYCLSSIDKRVRLRNMETVRKELQFFLDQRVRQVKFVDRTFNCNRTHAMEIWRFLMEHDNGITNFHFEIEADTLTEEQLSLLAKMRPGLAQMEIGVQTFHPETLKEIRRTTDMDKLCYVVNRLREGHNIHIHLDLIAGLPCEDYETFRESFNKVYALRPEQLQLGFLKVLKGSYMFEKAAEYKLQYLDNPPYEVLSTAWLFYEDVLRLKEVEEMVEIYYNSNQFVRTLRLLEQVCFDAFSLYEGLADFYREKGLFVQTPSRTYRYQVLYDFCMTTELSKWKELVQETLAYDLYLRENVKNRPAFIPAVTAQEEADFKRFSRRFYEQEEGEREILPDYAEYDSRQLAKMTHMEFLRYPVWEEAALSDRKSLSAPVAVLFDYRHRDPLTDDARTVVLEVVEETGRGEKA